MKKIVATPLFFTVVFFGVLLVANTILFFLRSFGEGWWLGDSAIYYGVDSGLHSDAYISFVAYWSIYFLVSLVAFSRRGRYVERKNLPFVFILVVVFFGFQIFSAINYGVGVASSVGSFQNPMLYLLILFSFDSFYYIYAVSEKSTMRYFFATLLFIASNIIRGWAGFVIPLFLIIFLRKRWFSRKFGALVAVGFVLAVPVLLVLRDYFRGGYSYFDSLESQGFAGVELYTTYFTHVLVAMLTRLDFYSNYIGISQMAGMGVNANMCIPVQENIFHKALIAAGISSECTSLGSLLPSFLYEFFNGKGTSFAVGSGFMALPADLLLYYFFSYFFVLIITSIYMGLFVRSLEIKCVFIFLSVFLLFQGWMYQFVYNLIGLFLAIALIKLKVVPFSTGKKNSYDMERG